MTLHDILSRLDVKSGNNGRYMARCPCHNDQQASLSVGVGDDGRVLLALFCRMRYDRHHAKHGADNAGSVC